MSQVVSTLFLVVLLVTSTTLDAQVLVPPMAFDCDAETGSVSTWTTGIKSPALRVQGTIEFDHLHYQFKSAPVTSVLLSSGSNAQTGFQFLLRRHKSLDLLQVGIVDPDDPTAQTVILTYPWKGKPLPFTLAISRSGDVNVTVGDESASLKVNSLKPNQLSLSCSAANVEFSNIVISRNSNDT